MNKLLIVLFTLLCLLGGSQNLEAGLNSGRAGQRVVPDATVATSYYPTAVGLNTTSFDGDMTVNLWLKGAGTVTIEIQATTFDTGEDPSNLSFTTVATRSLSPGVNKLDSVIGPATRVRFYVTACVGDCTTAIKVVGRVAP